MIKLFPLSCFVLFLISQIRAPPVTVLQHETPTIELNDTNLGLEYERYLKEVVSVLETDPVFRKKLEEANSSEIINGDIAKHLNFVDKRIRTKLDELKRNEIERLRNVIKLQDQLKQGIDIEKIISHLDHENLEEFSSHDLKKLIMQASQDLEAIDRKRKEEFKIYEMEKEHERREELKQMDDSHRIEAERKHKDAEEKKKKHPRVHHPGNEEQLKEVWKENDGLEEEAFDPKTFFFMHDTNGDGYLDEDETEALFQKELDKVYNEKDTEVDMVERYEEMNRMREHVMNEIDSNQDRMISLQEFLDSTKKNEFKKDEEWDTLDNETLYTDEEFMEFERSLQGLAEHETEDKLNHHPANDDNQNIIKMQQQHDPPKGQPQHHPDEKGQQVEHHLEQKGEQPNHPEHGQKENQEKHKDVDKDDALKFRQDQRLQQINPNPRRLKHDEEPKVYVSRPPSVAPVKQPLKEGELPHHPREPHTDD